jgi:uncharacterized membrane protein YccF (DUF307 family)
MIFRNSEILNVLFSCLKLHKISAHLHTVKIHHKQAFKTSKTSPVDNLEWSIFFGSWMSLAISPYTADKLLRSWDPMIFGNSEILNLLFSCWKLSKLIAHLYTVRIHHKQAFKTFKTSPIAKLEWSIFFGSWMSLAISPYATTGKLLRSWDPTIFRNSEILNVLLSCWKLPKLIAHLYTVRIHHKQAFKTFKTSPIANLEWSIFMWSWMTLVISS